MAPRDPAPGDLAGASARAEHERRRAARVQRNEARYGRTLGGLVSRASAPSHETAWARGADGEAAVAAALAKRCAPEVVVLHDRRWPGRRRANLDHIAVAPSGVWVIDTKRYRGKASVKTPLLGKPSLWINGRDETKLVDGVRGQADAVTDLLRSHGFGVEAAPVLCFVDTELPLLGLPRVSGVTMSSRRGLAKRLNAAGPLSTAEVSALAAFLDGALRPAVAG